MMPSPLRSRSTFERQGQSEKCSALCSAQRCPLLRSLLGAKRTCPFALHMSANDPKRTCCTPEPLPDYRCGLIRCVTFQRAIGGSDEVARVYHVSRRCGYLVGCGACATS